MNENDRISQAIGSIYRDESRRVLATLIRLVGDFELAEDAMQEAFAAALRQWPNEGIPSNPRAWLVSTGRFKAIDLIRRQVRLAASMQEMADQMEVQAQDRDEGDVADDQLRLIFTCCHPALSTEGQIALTLREVCGLTTEEIARAFLTSPTTAAQRIVRAKAKIRDAKIPYEVPQKSDLAERIQNVLRVTYLVFNEGYYASSGEAVTRGTLSEEAIRLGRLLADLLPDPEVLGLLALMLLQESRRAARTGPTGDLILLDDQDRSLWDRAMIAEGIALGNRARAENPSGVYALQAGIAAVHALAPAAAETDWNQIVGVYDVLASAHPSPVVNLNRSVAVAMRDGPAAGLAIVDALLGRELSDYGLAHSTRAEFCRRLGQFKEARQSYDFALNLATLEPEKRFLENRIQEMENEMSN